MNAKKKNKVLIIGIDGGTYNVILPLLREGKIPNIAKIFNNGAHGELMSTVPPVTAPAWSSFITGANPGKHGVFYFFKNDINKYDINGNRTLNNFHLIKGVPFWRILNKHGHKVGLINIPLTYPPDKVDGFMISGMLVPDGAKDYVYPPEIYAQLEDYKVDLDGLMKQNKWRGKALFEQKKNMFIESVYRLSEVRVSNALKLMNNYEWDVFMVVFTGSDRISHFYWKDKETEEAPSRFVKDYYIYLDGLIGRLIREAGDDTIKIIMSDHGFGEAPAKSINLYALMKYLGHSAMIPHAALSYLKRRIMLKMKIVTNGNQNDLVDWKRTKIFAVPIYGNFLGICINTSGEKKWGIVERGEEYNSLKKEIMEKLEDIADPVSGEKMVTKIISREDTYKGSFMPDAPDIVVEFSYNYGLHFNPLKRKLVKSILPFRSGDHRREGVFMISGQDIKCGGIEKEIFIEDIPATLLHLFEIPVPELYDGKIIQEIFSKEYLEGNPVTYTEEDWQLEAKADEQDNADKKQFEMARELLKNLGYM